MRAVVVTVLLSASVAHAERAVTGAVIDGATGAPIAGAVVVVGAVDAITDDAGGFRVDDVPFGRQEVVVVADGYAPYFGAVRIGGALTIRLTADRSGLEVIRLAGRAPSQPPLHLGSEEIRLLPGAGNDALRALQSLPGVARTPFGLGGLALRGTAPRDTKVYLDGVEVPLLYHFGGLASFVPTDVVDELTLEPGGASVRYGRGLGGVATITTRTGDRDRTKVGGELSLIHAAVVGETPGPAAGSWLLAVRRSYFDAIQAAAGIASDLAPRYGDAQLRWESGDGRWMALAIGSDDVLRLAHDPDDGSTGGVNTSNVESFGYTSRFARLALRYRTARGATQLTLVPSVGIDDVNARANHNDTDKGLHRTTIPVSLRGELATPLLAGTLALGVDGGAALNRYAMLNTPPPTPADPMPSSPVARSLERWTADVGAWLEGSWFVWGQRLELRPGVRGDHFGLSDQWTLDPRLALHLYLPHDVELAQHVGRYHAPPLITDLDPIFGERRMVGASAIQAATTVKAIVGDQLELSATAYYQDLRQLPVDAVSAATPISANGTSESGGALAVSRELVDSQFGSYSYREAIGTGHAYGLELIARKNLGRVRGWIAYTRARSFRVNPTHGPEARPYVMDQPNQLTVVAAAALPAGWRVGGRFRYATGNPFTPAIGATMDPDGSYTPIDGPLLSERLPAFWQLDLRVDHLWHRPWGTIDLYLDVQNVTWRDNAEGVAYSRDYTQRRYTSGLPIFPALGVVYTP